MQRDSLPHQLFLFCFFIYTAATEVTYSGSCVTVQTDSATMFTWPITWVPESNPHLKFSVKVSDGDGVARVILASDTTPKKPYIVLQLGWNEDKTGIFNTNNYTLCCLK